MDLIVKGGLGKVVKGTVGAESGVVILQKIAIPLWILIQWYGEKLIVVKSDSGYEFSSNGILMFLTKTSFL